MAIINKKAFHDYFIEEKSEAGLKLLGPEVKSIKGGRMILSGAYIKIIGSEAYLVNSNIPLYSYARPEGYQPLRTRKLLLHKKEIIDLKAKTDGSGLTIVPLKCYTTHGLVKLEIGIGKGKKQYEKRDELRKRAIEKEIKRTLRGKI